MAVGAQLDPSKQIATNVTAMLSRCRIESYINNILVLQTDVKKKQGA